MDHFEAFAMMHLEIQLAIIPGSSSTCSNQYAD
jgi:hypothetical protein